jgi:hypothetical protein
MSHDFIGYTPVPLLIINIPDQIPHLTDQTASDINAGAGIAYFKIINLRETVKPV